MDKHTDLISRLQDEADLCRNDGATDIAALLDEAVAALQAPRPEVAGDGSEALHMVGPALHELAVAEERKRLIAEFRKRHQQNQMHHNWYACLAREMEDGLL